jgi:hypothetical protein
MTEQIERERYTIGGDFAWEQVQPAAFLMKDGRVIEYHLDFVTAKCGCRFLVGNVAVGQEIADGVFELVAEIPQLEPPETPSVWAHEHVIDPHADECLAMRTPNDFEDAWWTS